MVSAAAFAFGLLTAGSAAAGAQPPAEAPPPSEAQPSLAEAARKNRVRIQASQEQHGPAPRFTDADLGGGRPPGAARSAPAPSSNVALEKQALREPAIASEDLPLDALDEDTAGADPEGQRAAMDARLREIGEREAEIRDRLLDIEASLTAIGSSGLPYAQRNPNRLRSPLDTSRLRAERDRLLREREALAAERRILR